MYVYECTRFRVRVQTVCQLQRTELLSRATECAPKVPTKVDHVQGPPLRSFQPHADFLYAAVFPFSLFPAQFLSLATTTSFLSHDPPSSTRTQVIIELCSKHLDKDCYGSDTMTDLSTSPPPARTERPEQTPSTPCGSTAACAPSRLLTTRKRAETSSPLPPPRIGGVKRKTSSGIEQKGKDGHAMPPPAVTTPPVVDTLCGCLLYTSPSPRDS